MLKRVYPICKTKTGAFSSIFSSCISCSMCSRLKQVALKFSIFKAANEASEILFNVNYRESKKPKRRFLKVENVQLISVDTRSKSFLEVEELKLA